MTCKTGVVFAKGVAVLPRCFEKLRINKGFSLLNCGTPGSKRDGVTPRYFRGRRGFQFDLLYQSFVVSPFESDCCAAC